MAAKADLHIHTTYSDGKKSPLEVLNLAASKGLKAISFTDHDTVKGYLKGVEVLKSEQLLAKFPRITRGGHLPLLT